TMLLSIVYKSRCARLNISSEGKTRGLGPYFTTGDQMGVWSDSWGGRKGPPRPTAIGDVISLSRTAAFIRESRTMKIIASAVVLFAGVALTIFTGGLGVAFGQLFIAGGASMLMTTLLSE
ncbi:hypothetical protein PENTCL1PPCAC_12443, partial [Pristionchus entomophagus]